MTQNRCADYKIPLRLLLAVAVVCCCLATCIESRAQFSNMRVFRTNGMFNKDHWRPMDILKSFKINKEQETDSSRAAEIVSASSIKRVSMASLLQQLNQVNNGKKDVFFPTPIATKQEESSLSIPVTIIESNHSVVTPVVKESTIRRVKLPAGSISYSRNGPASNGPSILLNINPHLQRSTRFPSTEPATTTTELSTTTTTEPSTTTTTEPSTTTTEPSTSTATEPCVTKVYVKAKPHEQQAAKHYANKAKTPASVRADNILASSKKLSQMPNSPIYYIKLPASSFVSGRTPHKEDAVPLDFFKQSPIFVATTRRPSNSGNVVEEIATTEAPSETSLSTTTRFPPRTNSRVINIKGPFVFNGKPGGIYSAPAPYRPPNYLDLLHQLYPKLKRAQFIRR